MQADGAALGTLRTRAPHYFRRFGWAVCGRHCMSRARARDFLALFWADPALRSETLNIRQWRHVELPALMRIYAQNTRGACGASSAPEAYWRWLICRRAFDHIVVALAGPDKLELNETLAPIAGYAVIRQRQVVELFTDPAFPTAGPQLLARACADAIEQDFHEIALHAPPADRLHSLIQTAGGELHHGEASEGEVYMVKLFNPADFLEKLLPVLAVRAAASAPPWELGLLVESEKYLLSGGRQNPTFHGPARPQLRGLQPPEFVRLLLGHDDPARSAAQGRLRASTQTALALAAQLFPRLPLWQPAWDDLAA